MMRSTPCVLVYSTISAAASPTAARAMDLYAGLGVASDGAHAFYLGVELARAEIAWRLGKRYVQDQDLDWHSAAASASVAHSAPGPTLPARRRRGRP